MGFGVGFYSGFMVAKKIIVLSKKADSDESWKWESEGRGEFDIEKSDKKERGTIVQIFLKDKEKDFAEKLRVENIIKKYSDHISHSVFLNDKNAKKDEEEKANKG